MDKRKIVEQQCANYDRNGHCLLETFEGSTICPVYYGLGARCKYFDSCVSPSESMGVKCERCNQPYERRSNRQKYCSNCQLAKKRERARYSALKVRS